MLKILKNKNFKYLFIGLLTSHIGNSLFILSLFWYVQSKTGEPKYLVWLGLMTTIPIVFGFFGGVLSDKYDRRNIMMFADGFRLVLVIILTLLITFSEFDFSYIAIIYLLINLGNFIFIPACNAIIPDIVEEDNLFAANGLVQSTGQISTILGALVGGILLTLVDTNILFLVNALTFLVSLVCLSLIKKQKEDTSKDPLSVKSGVFNHYKDFVEGLKYMFSYNVLKGLLPGIFVINLFFVPFFTLGPAWSVEILNKGSFGYAAMEVFIALGVLTGSLATKYIDKHLLLNKSIVLSLLLMLNIIYFPLTSNLYINILSLFMFNMGLGIWNTLLFSLLQIHVSEKFRGRVFGSLFSIVGFAFPLGAAMFGVLLDFIDLRQIFILSSSFLFISVVYIGLFLNYSNKKVKSNQNAIEV
ncbi:MFS transporter [Rossellomorea aquimaris]|uniref:Putative MFS family arabinose efflux permease n=1 Tax=Rossellomorea aquimaris TaxID=189382 RepID=A0A366EI85_9BACI|nr:MFS transporter [Rossellomorea aquimaris]RBP02131.1 putative MFS family arabinose efflux permease [Rossellomorea aquimaris]